MQYYNLEKLAADMGASEGAPKEAAWRDLPHLARGVMANMREHTLPRIREANDLHHRLKKIGVGQMTQRQRADIAAEFMGGNAREREAAARLRRMWRGAGMDPDTATDKLQYNRFVRAYNDPSNPQLQKRYERLTGISHSLLTPKTVPGEDLINHGKADDVRALMKARIQDRLHRPSREMMGLVGQHEADIVARYPLDDSFLSGIGGKKLRDVAPPAIVERISKDHGIEDPYHMRHGVTRVVFGRTGKDVERGQYASQTTPLLGFANARSQPVLAHELGHATGVGSLATGPISAVGRLTALKLPEEFRAEMRAQDIMRDWKRRGVASGLPPELSTMSEDELKKHTLFLSTYADKATREIARAGFNARDRLDRFKDRIKGRLK